eukprot:8337180-Alexandrium_andersonii.AAC.1
MHLMLRMNAQETSHDNMRIKLTYIPAGIQQQLCTCRHTGCQHSRVFCTTEWVHLFHVHGSSPRVSGIEHHNSKCNPCYMTGTQ